MCNYLHLQASSVQITSTFCFEVPLGAAMLVHFLPLKGWAKGLDTLFASECQKVLAHYTFASEGQKVPKHLILLPHILAVLTLILMPVILVIVIHTAECKMAALPFDHIHVFTTIKPQRLKKRMRNRVGLLTTAFVPQVGWNERSLKMFHWFLVVVFHQI